MLLSPIQGVRSSATLIPSLAMLTSSRHSVAPQFPERRCSTSQVPLRRGRLITAAKQKQDDKRKQPVKYGNDWFSATRERPRTVKEEIAWRKQANWEANNGRERKDLYTDAWAGDKWKGSKFNILSLVVLLFLLTPVAGLVFAYFTYGNLWG